MGETEEREALQLLLTMPPVPVLTHGSLPGLQPLLGIYRDKDRASQLPLSLVASSLASPLLTQDTGYFSAQTLLIMSPIVLSKSTQLLRTLAPPLPEPLRPLTPHT